MCLFRLIDTEQTEITASQLNARVSRRLNEPCCLTVSTSTLQSLNKLISLFYSDRTPRGDRRTLPRTKNCAFCLTRLAAPMKYVYASSPVRPLHTQTEGSGGLHAVCLENVTKSNLKFTTFPHFLHILHFSSKANIRTRQYNRFSANFKKKSSVAR